MNVAHFPDDPPPRWHQPVLALGNFDGLHRGHMKIIDRVRRRAGERGGTPAAMTFDPHPPRVVRPDKAPPLLMTTEQKLEALARAGMQGVAVVRFTPELSQWDPETFVRTVLVEWLHVVGSVGRRQLPVRPRARRHLQRAAQPRRALRVPRREDRSGPLQGFRRQQHADPAAGAGRTGRRSGGAARPSLLHRRHGGARRRARPRDRVSRPRISRPRNELLPPSGVYATTSTIDGVVHPSMTNIGLRPTFGDVDRVDGRDAHVRPRSRSVRRRRSGCRSSSGCATSARSRMSTRCARRSTPTAAARGGCSAAFRCRICLCPNRAGPRTSRRWSCASRFLPRCEYRAIVTADGREGGGVPRRRRAAKWRRPRRRSRRSPRRSPSPARCEADATFEFRQSGEALLMRARCAGRSADASLAAAVADLARRPRTDDRTDPCASTTR